MMTLLRLAVVLQALISVSLASPITPQIVLQSSEPSIQSSALSTSTTPDYSNFVLASVFALLKSWPTAFAPNGHAALPATIKTGTLLYHGGSSAGPPTGMEWFAFDAEHSFQFARGGRDPNSTTMGTLYTFAATRPLKVLHFDGFSAAKTSLGTLDLQGIIAYNSSEKAGDGPFNGDMERSQLLCQWGKQFGIEGFVREEATFELIWCDFGVGVELVGSANVTGTFEQIEEDPEKREEPPSLPPGGGRPGEGPPGGPGRGRGRFPRESNPYAVESQWHFYRAASWHHTLPDSRITLHPAYFTTFYQPYFPSIASSHFNTPVQTHRLNSTSPKDDKRFKRELEEALTRWQKDGVAAEEGKVDWSQVVQAVVQRNADRLSELKMILSPPSSSLNVTLTTLRSKRIVYALLMPYLDAPTVLSTFPSPPPASIRAQGLLAASQKCSKAFTGHLHDLPAAEETLKHAVETVLGRICDFSSKLLEEALDLEIRGVGREADVLVKWDGQLKELMNWLGWAGIWKRCPRQCDWDEVCYVPMWPIEGFGAGTELDPQCRKVDALSRYN